MSVMIRLARQGGKKNPIYKVVALDKRKKRQAAFLEDLGQYRPKEADPKNKLKINLEAVQAWQAKGAQLSQTVGQLIENL